MDSHQAHDPARLVRTIQEYGYALVTEILSERPEFRDIKSEVPLMLNGLIAGFVAGMDNQECVEILDNIDRSNGDAIARYGDKIVMDWKPSYDALVASLRTQRALPMESPRILELNYEKEHDEALAFDHKRGIVIFQAEHSLLGRDHYIPDSAKQEYLLQNWVFSQDEKDKNRKRIASESALINQRFMM